jgi:hypothetical protein
VCVSVSVSVSVSVCVCVCVGGGMCVHRGAHESSGCKETRVSADLVTEQKCGQHADTRI